MDVSPWRWNASISTGIPIRPSVLGRVTCGTELVLLQQISTVGFKSEDRAQCQPDPPS